MKDKKDKVQIPPGYFTPYDHPDWRAPTQKTWEEEDGEIEKFNKQFKVVIWIVSFLLGFIPTQILLWWIGFYD